MTPIGAEPKIYDDDDLKRLMPVISDDTLYHRQDGADTHARFKWMIRVYMHTALKTDLISKIFSRSCIDLAQNVFYDRVYVQNFVAIRLYLWTSRKFGESWCLRDITEYSAANIMPLQSYEFEKKNS